MRPYMKPRVLELNEIKMTVERWRELTIEHIADYIITGAGYKCQVLQQK